MTGCSCRAFFAMRVWGVLGLGTSLELATLTGCLRYAAQCARGGVVSDVYAA